MSTLNTTTREKEKISCPAFSARKKNQQSYRRSSSYDKIQLNQSSKIKQTKQLNKIQYGTQELNELRILLIQSSISPVFHELRKIQQFLWSRVSLPPFMCHMSDFLFFTLFLPTLYIHMWVKKKKKKKRLTRERERERERDSERAERTSNGWKGRKYRDEKPGGNSAR